MFDVEVFPRYFTAVVGEINPCRGESINAFYTSSDFSCAR